MRDEALAAICDTFVPGVDGLPSASDLGVPALLLSEVRSLGRRSMVRDLERLLWAIETPALSLALFGRPVRFSSLPRPEREALLRRWAESPIALKRMAFQDLKRLTLLYTYGQEGSPYRDVLGYAPPVLDPPSPTELVARTPVPGETVEADVCVIGSGAGGGVAAAVLAAAGKRAVVLERAPLATEASFDGGELSGFARFFIDRGLLSTDDRAISIRAGSALGGGTVVNWSTSLRLPDEVREEWAAAGITEDLSVHYDAVEARIRVTTAESQRNGPNAMLERGLQRRGLPYVTTRRNVDGCGDCGPCAVGCRRGAKQSTLRTYLVDACRAGAIVLHGTEAARIVVRDGRVQGVVARVAGGECVVRAPQVALAGGAVLSPVLLLRSGIASDRAGRGLRIHPVAAVVGRYAERMEAWRGVPQSVMSEAFASVEGAHGIHIEAAPSHPGVFGLAWPWWGADDHLAAMREGAHLAPFVALVRDREPGRVYIDRDGAVAIRYFPGAMERRLLVRGMRELTDLHLAAGATSVHTLHTPPLALSAPSERQAFLAEIERRGVVPNRILLFSAHQMSTCAIGTSEKTSVADPDGQVWGVRGLFVTDASAFPSGSGVNPMLTIMALARRTAMRMAAA